MAGIVASAGRFDQFCGRGGSAAAVGANIELASLIPAGQLDRLLSQDHCELEWDPDYPGDGMLAGAAAMYLAAADLVPTSHTIIDLGCYMGAQAWFFASHRAYIGVDTIGPDWCERFAAPNTTHHVRSIQDFIADNPDLCGPGKAVTALCFWVPDPDASRAAREAFDNIWCWYPTG